MAAVQRIFGVPFVPARLLPLAVAAAAVPLAPAPGVRIGPADWVVALGSAVLTIAGGTWPLPVVLGQSALLVLAAYAAVAGRETVQALTAFALLELFMRRTGPVRPVGAVVVAGATVVDLWRITGGDLPRTLFWSVPPVAVPAGLGVHMWSLRLWMSRYHTQFREAERLRAAETLAARATERTAIARELHDLVAHHVASIVLRVGVARHVVAGTDEAVTAVLDDVYTAGNTALADLRELVGVLRDPATAEPDGWLSPLDPADLPAALGEVAERITRTGLPVTTAIDPAIVDLDAVRRLAVLRIAQDGLTNALRHATGATGAELRVRLADDATVTIEIRDDGTPAPARSAGGHGLLGLGERVELIGGSFRAGPGATGWLVRATLPAPSEEAVRR